MATTRKQSTDEKPFAGLDAGPWMEEMRKMFGRYQLPGVDVGALVEWQRKDIEAVVEANRQAYEGMKALVERRNEILKETLAEWQEAVKDVAGGGGLSKQAETARQGMEKAVANFRELAQLEAQARTSAWKVVQDRMQENMSNLQKLLQPKS